MSEQFLAAAILADVNALTWHAILYVLAVVGPMAPAIVIYRIFPQTKVGVGGPIGSLTMKASGAFAAYVVTFALAIPLVKQFGQSISAMQHPYWTVIADVVATEGDKEIRAPELLGDLKIILRPDVVETTGGVMRVTIPVKGDEWPIISAEIPNWGAAERAVRFPEDLGDATVNNSTREIRLKKAIRIPKSGQ